MRQLLPLQYIDTIARQGSIRKAADVLAITPSALNRRLLTIEDELGVQLFERVASGVRPSTAGEILLDHIRSQISDMERVQSRIADLSGMRRGNVALALGPDLPDKFFSRFINDYRAEFPGVTFRLSRQVRGEAEDALSDHSADIAIVFEPLRLAAVQIVCRVRQPVVCLVHHDHPLAGADTVRLYDCVGLPIAMPLPTSGVRAILDQAAARLGISLETAVQSEQTSFLRQCASAGREITFAIPASLPDNLAAEGLVAKPIDSRDVPDGYLFVGHLKGRALPVAAARFLETLVAHLSARFD